jgi:hypothetical protein
MYTLENCEKLWDEAGRHGSVEERIERTKRWEPYYGYLAKKALSAPEAESFAEPPLVTYMVKEGILTPDSTVLDIGAGMGSYALSFAKNCREVSALEPVGACLDVLQHKAAQHGLRNIHGIHDYWEHFSPTKVYDMTFSSMCPAICNTEELRRMESMTGKTCCLVAVQRGSYDKHRKTMMAGLQIKPQGGMTTEAIHYINALYLMGRQPNVKFFEFRKTSRVSAETVLEQYPIYFEIFGIEKETSVPFLQQYLTEHAVDGFLEDESYLRQALIYWHKEQAKFSVRITPAMTTRNWQ